MSDISLKEMLGRIPGSYDDFVEGVLDIVADNREREGAIREFISEKRSVTTSDVIEYIDDVLTKR